jgi:hypothetical protein
LDTNYILKPLRNDKKFVAFFDILGFSNTVRRTDIKVLSSTITKVLLPGIEDSVYKRMNGFGLNGTKRI